MSGEEKKKIERREDEKGKRVLISCVGRLSEQYVLEFYLKTLLSKPCQNQGFILDGFPKTFEQAKTLFDGECVTWSPHTYSTLVYHSRRRGGGRRRRWGRGGHR